MRPAAKLAGLAVRPYGSRISEPVVREKPTTELQLINRRISLELGTVTEAPIAAFLLRLPDMLNGALHFELLEIERKLPFDDDLIARIRLGERPDVLLTRAQLRIGTIGGKAEEKKAPL